MKFNFTKKHIVMIAVVGLITIPSFVVAGGGSMGPGSTVSIPTSYFANEAQLPANQTAAVTVGSENTPGTSGAIHGSVSPTVDLWYAWNRWLGTHTDANNLPSSDTTISGYVDGLSNPTVNYGYDRTVLDSNNNLVAKSSTVQVGQVLKFKFQPLNDLNIAWFGSGFSMDSPYGHWQTGATAPARSGNKVLCNANDFVVNYGTNFGGSWDVYVPLDVNPPTQTLTNQSGLSCSAPAIQPDTSVIYTCTVTSTGTLTPTFNWSSTYGYFYYRYYDYRGPSSNTLATVPGCYGNNIPMTSSFGTPATFGPVANSATSVQPGYQLSLPALSDTYSLTAVPAASPPTAPTITGPTTGTTGTAYPYTFTSTDPNSHNINYEIDWNNDGVVDQILPATGYVASGVTQTQTYQWNTAGTYTFQAYTLNDQGAKSGWTSYTVTITNPPANLTASMSATLTATAGVSVVIPATITNSGSGATYAPFPTTYFLSSASDMSNATDPFTYPGNGNYLNKSGVGNYFTNGVGNPNGYSPGVSETIGVGNLVTVPVTYTFPSAGTYYVRACADEFSNMTGVITESSMSDNCSYPTTVVTVTAADLRASNPSPVSLVEGQPNLMTDTAVNQSSTVGTGGTGFWNNFQVCDPTSALAKGSGIGNCSNYNYLNGQVSVRGVVTIPGGNPTGGYWYAGTVPASSSVPISFTYTPPTSQPYTFDSGHLPDIGEVITHPSIGSIFAYAKSLILAFATPSVARAQGAGYALSYRWCANMNTGWGSIVPVVVGNIPCSSWATMNVTPPTLTCSVSPSTGVVGSQTTWTANPGGFTPTSYTWTDSSGMAIGGTTSATYNNYYRAGGNYTTSVSATDGTVTASGTCSPGVTIANSSVTLTATPARVQSGSTSGITFTWTSTNLSNAYDTCSITGTDGYASATGLPSTYSGSSYKDTTAISTQTTYTITCHSGTAVRSGLDVSGTALVNVVPKFTNF